ncbi:MAG: sugar phosphate isomerase/epimerase [Tepidanaerobacteraceae bacterium]|jgi:fatty-acyl-CoA synthase|nr:sugar phosphate isomerase/epimerase [Tepidanaerobacteraceae bacterium]
MKFAFSTLSCPDWLWEEIITTASDLGYDGVELRGIGSEIYLPRVEIFSPENIPAIKSRLNSLRLEIPCLASGALLFDPEKKTEALKETADYLALAGSLEIPYVRVLGDAQPEPGTADASIVEENLLEILPLAAQKNVTLLLETNGVFADSNKMVKFMEKIHHPNLAVLWDVHHPFRYFHEQVHETYSRLKPWIRHVHIKDSIVKDGRVQYRMFGYGDVPAADAVRELSCGGFRGYVVLEWVKRWCMDIEEPGIVIPHFINAVKNMLPQ